MKSFWKHTHVLVTGGKGFVGSHLVQKLKKEGADVTVLSSTSDATHSTRHVMCNIQKREHVRKLFASRHFDVCFHLAAKSHVAYGEQNPVEVFEANTQGTWNILDMCREFQISGVVMASTTHVYADQKSPFHETMHARISRPYETSKALADLVGQLYVTHYDLPLTIARCSNIYGPGDTSVRIIPETIHRLLDGNIPTVYTPVTVRDYIYIDDAVSAYIALAEFTIKTSRNNNKKEYIFNIGSGKAYSSLDIVKKLITLSRKNTTWNSVKMSSRSDIATQYVSIKKSLSLLDWKPVTQIDEGLQHTFDWCKANQNLFNRP